MKYNYIIQQYEPVIANAFVSLSKETEHQQGLLTLCLEEIQVWY